MKRYVLVAVLLGCAAFFDTPDEHGPQALSVVRHGGPEVFAEGEGIVVGSDLAGPRLEESRHLRRI